MKTGKLLVPVICGVMHCIMSVSTLTRLPQYEIAVMVGNYTNPYQVRQFSLISCSYGCLACCDGFAPSFQCHRCDSFFTYCLRNVDTLTAGCPGGGNIMRSNVNPNDTSIDFSQNTVLGLDNPLVFQGLSDTWNGVQLYIEIRDQDQDGSQLIDIVRWNITQPVQVPSGAIKLTGFYEIVTMEVNITVLCVPGFTGTMCEENINDCDGVTCGENHQCIDGVNSSTCNCTLGFTGALCNETAISESRQRISVIPIVCGAVGALILIIILTLLVITTLKCASKHCSGRVSKSDDSAISETPKEPIEMKENEVYGIYIAAPKPEKPPQESVLMSTNICYSTMIDLKINRNNKQPVLL